MGYKNVNYIIHRELRPRDQWCSNIGGMQGGNLVKAHHNANLNKSGKVHHNIMQMQTK
jgi:hypothetical protein